MGEIDKKIEKIEKEIAHKIETKWDLWTPPISIEDVLWLIDQLKKCRSNYGDLYQRLKPEIEQRTKETCFKAGWAWIQDDFGEQFGYDPTDDTDKEDFKQVIGKARGE